MLMSLTEVVCFSAGSAIGVPVDNKLVNDANVRGLGLERNGGFLGQSNMVLSKYCLAKSIRCGKSK